MTFFYIVNNDTILTAGKIVSRLLPLINLYLDKIALGLLFFVARGCLDEVSKWFVKGFTPFMP